MNLSYHDIERFKSKVSVSRDGCWEWRGGYASNGYGMFWVSSVRKNRGAHRTSYIIYKGDIEKSQLVLHKCDNTKCVNPLHLYVGTQQQNMNDKVSRGRAIRGIKHHKNRYTEDQIREVKRLLERGLTCKSISVKTEVGIDSVKQVKNGKNWKHI